MQQTSNISSNAQLRLLRNTYIDHVYEAAKLSGIDAPPRDVFKRDVKNPTYSVWLATRGDMAKGRTTCAPEWLDLWLGYERLVAQMGPRPDGSGLKRLDPTRPWSSENAQWARKVQSSGLGLPPRRLLANRTAASAESILRLGLHPNQFVHDKRNYLYNTWTAMNARCNDPGSPQFKNYGGRSIKIYRDWDDGHNIGFEMFVSWVLENLGERQKGYTLDRIDNDGNYEPGNLRWATRAEQGANTRTAKKARERRIRVGEMLEAEMSVAEIAGNLECSMTTARRLVSDARKAKKATEAHQSGSQLGNEH